MMTVAPWDTQDSKRNNNLKPMSQNGSWAYSFRGGEIERFFK